MSPHPRPRSTTPLLAAMATFVLAAFVLAGCSAGSSGSSDSSGSSGSAADVAAASSAEAGAQTASDLSAAPADRARAVVATQRAVISTGTVALSSPDVDATLFEVQKVVDQARGQVTERSAETQQDGAVRYARLVIRVPAAGLTDAMAALEDAADLVSSDSGSEDVTTQVIDTDVRVEVQQRSIERITLLLDRAESIKDIVAIEAQLSQREADLGSLQQQQTYLADQTSESTITLSVERPGQDQAIEDGGGFRAGLAAGWSALSGFAAGSATVLGALLPFLVLAALIGVPGVAVARRLRRRTAGAAGAAGTSGAQPTA